MDITFKDLLPEVQERIAAHFETTRSDLASWVIMQVLDVPLRTTTGITVGRPEVNDYVMGANSLGDIVSGWVNGYSLDGDAVYILVDDNHGRYYEDVLKVNGLLIKLPDRPRPLIAYPQRR